MSKLEIDFLNGKIRTLLKTASKSQPLGKAVGLRPELQILDATAGLGRDSLFLARLGAKVISLERDPHIYLLLEQAMKVAQAEPQWCSFFKTLPQFLHISFQEYSVGLKERPQVVYLDPMYPDLKKSALPKGDIQLMREHLGPQEDIREMLDVALNMATERVVVKRPSEVESLQKPTHVFEGKLVRYDMYKV